jgi:hypothetical protein
MRLQATRAPEPPSTFPSTARALLQHTTASPRQLTQIVRAALVLTQFEHKYIR